MVCKTVFLPLLEGKCLSLRGWQYFDMKLMDRAKALCNGEGLWKVSQSISIIPAILALQTTVGLWKISSFCLEIRKALNNGEKLFRISYLKIQKIQKFVTWKVTLPPCTPSYRQPHILCILSKTVGIKHSSGGKKPLVCKSAEEQ